MKLKFKIQKQIGKQVKGFTIIELMVAMTITLVIVGLLLGMTKIAVGAWQTTNNKAKSSRLAGEVFEILGRDLEGLVIRSGNSFEWLNISDNLLSGDDIGPTGSQITNTLDLNFFTATPDRYDGQISGSPGGDVSLVRYRLIYQDVIDGSSSGTPVYSLYRERIEPDEAFTDLLGEDELEDVLPDGDDINAVENILADNIYDFTISFNFEFTIDDGTKVYERVTVQAGSANDSLSIKGDDILIAGDPIDIPPGAAAPRIASADISVFVISDGGMKILNSPGGLVLPPGETFADFLQRHGTSYTKSVLLPQP